MQQAYDKLIADAQAVGVAEQQVQSWLAEKGMLVDRMGDLVIFTDESPEAFEYAASKLEPEVTPELAEYRRLKALAERSGITQEQFQQKWKKLGDKKNPDRITKARLTAMATELEVMIKDSLDRQFAKVVYGLEFPKKKETDWAPAEVGWKRLTAGWKPGAYFDPQMIGILTIGEVNHEPLGYVRLGDDDDVAAVVVSEEAEESGSATVHDSEGPEEDDSPAATMLYQELCQRWADTYDKAKIDWLLEDYCNGTDLSSDELNEELLKEFEAYLHGVKALTGESELERTEVGIVDRNSGRALTLFDEDLPDIPDGTALISFEEGSRLVESIVEKQGGTEKFLAHITDRIREKTKLLKDRTSKYYPLLRSLVEPELPRYEKNTFKKDGSGEIAHRAGELKKSTYKGFSGGDVIFRKTGGLKLPKQFVLDNWAAAQCKDILETLQEAADDWLANHAPPEVRAVTKIQVSTKVSKKMVRQFADDYHYPGVERLPIHDTGNMFVGSGGPWTIKKEIGELAAALNELAAACGDNDEEGEEE